MIPEHGMPQRLGFLTLPNYSMIALSNALEAARMANYVAERELYYWRIVTLDGAPALASNGLSLGPTVKLGSLPFDMLFVCGGVKVREATDQALLSMLRKCARVGNVLGSLCTGAFALAEAGLLDGRACAIHWENLAAIREEFPEIRFVDRLFVIDGDRITCTGGVAPLDMMLSLIARDHGRDLAAQVSAQFIVSRIRSGEEAQAGGRPLDTAIEDPLIAEASAVMREMIDAPAPMIEIADRVGVSVRQLERVFKRDRGMGPAEVFLAMRLARARELLRLSRMSITDVALSCGFQSPAHFSATYRRRFGHAPRAERTRHAINDAGRAA